MATISDDLPAAAKKLEGKVALITGGASGIGECTVRLFCRHGAKVVVADIQDQLGEALCRDLGHAASFVHCDVTSEDDVSRAVDHAVQKFGKLDIMFNNAGIAGSPIPNILDSKKADFERVLAVNTVGPFLGTKHAARVMIPAGKGSIIATSSVAGVVGGTTTYAYTCAKHAVVGLTKNAAIELGRFGIRVNCISPMMVVTPMVLDYLGMEEGQGSLIEAAVSQLTALKQVTLKTEDVAQAVLYLASDEAKYVSGQNLVVDGAITAGCAMSVFDNNVMSKVDV